MDMHVEYLTRLLGSTAGWQLRFVVSGHQWCRTGTVYGTQVIWIKLQLWLQQLPASVRLCTVAVDGTR